MRPSIIEVFGDALIEELDRHEAKVLRQRLPVLQRGVPVEPESATK